MKIPVDITLVTSKRTYLEAGIEQMTVFYLNASQLMMYQILDMLFYLRDHEPCGLADLYIRLCYSNKLYSNI